MDRRLTSLLASCGALVVMGAVGFEAWGQNPFAYRDDKIVAEGEAIYAESCASCHGVGLEGQPNWRESDADGYLPAPPHDDTGHTWHHPDPQLLEIVRNGTAAYVGGGYRSNMPGFGDVLSDDQILAVLAYIKHTWPKRIIARHDELNEAYEAAN